MPEIFIVVGLGYGDEGKGTIVDYLARTHNGRLVVRFNGGAQAAHNVVTPNGKHHTFAQFGSGTLAGAGTHLSRFMMVNPFDLTNEARHLKELGIKHPLETISFSPEALVTTPLHVAANQIREEQRINKHGTCGKGIGETQASSIALGDAAIRMSDLRWQGIVEAKLAQLSQHYSTTLLETFEKEHGPIDEIARSYRNLTEHLTIRDDDYVQDMINAGSTVIFEGAQGILLDQDVGFHPHTTWSNTTSKNARSLIRDHDNITVIGVTRPYGTRHGAGPLVGDGSMLPMPEPHNAGTGLQGAFRFAPWDAIALDYAAKCDSIDAVAVTCLDQLEQDWQSTWSYQYSGGLPDLAPYFWADNDRIFSITPDSNRAHVEAVANRLKDCTANVNVHDDVNSEYVVDAIGEVLHAPVILQSFGPTWADKKERVLTWTEIA